MALQIEVGNIILTGDDEEATIVSIKGRWVKLDNDTNISRAEALEGLEAYNMQEADLDAEDQNEADLSDDEDEEEVGSKMSSTLVKYRPIYVKSTSANGNASLHNGDEVAELLSRLSPDETCAVADHLFGEFPGTHYEKYARLNLGSRRMNAGNRIRALIKRGEKTIADLEAAIKGDDLKCSDDEMFETEIEGGL